MTAVQPTDALSPLVLAERDGLLVRLTLNRPSKANALNAEIVEEIHAALDALERDPPRLLVLKGAGPAFCSGFDLEGAETASDGDLLYRFVRIELMLQRVFHASFATLALAHGRSFGAGADLFAACSSRVAAPGLTLRMPGWRFGIALGTRRLVHRIGAGLAQSMLVEARTVAADAAVSMGLATDVVAEAQWPESEARALAAAQALDAESTAALARIVVPDTREADLGALAVTAGRPGLARRIAAYRDAQRAAASSRSHKPARG